MSELQLFPRLTYVKDLKANTYGTPEKTPEDQLRNLPLLYHPLPDNDNQNCPQKVLPPFNHLGPILDTVQGIAVNQARQTIREQPGQDLGHNNLLELFGYDEDLGLTLLTLDTGTEIEIPIKDVQRTIFWIADQVTSAQTGSLIFKIQFPGCVPGGGA